MYYQIIKWTFTMFIRSQILTAASFKEYLTGIFRFRTKFNSWEITFFGFFHAIFFCQSNKTGNGVIIMFDQVLFLQVSSVSSLCRSKWFRNLKFRFLPQKKYKKNYKKPDLRGVALIFKTSYMIRLNIEPIVTRCWCAIKTAQLCNSLQKRETGLEFFFQLDEYGHTMRWISDAEFF